MQELEIKHLASSSETLAAILVNFPDLRKLKLPYVGLQDASFVHPYEGILQKLEELEIKTSSSTSERFLELVLFHENLQLPSLHTLDYHLCYTNNLTCLNCIINYCSWVKQLKSLTLQCQRSLFPSETFNALMSVLDGGPLESFSVIDWKIADSSWNNMRLSNLRTLDLTFEVSNGSFFDWFAQNTSLRNLEVAKICVHREQDPLSFSANGIEEFTSAFPCLHSLTLNIVGMTIPHIALRQIFVHLLPQLEEITLVGVAGDLQNTEANEDQDDYMDMFGTEDEENLPSSTAKWPKLRKIVLHLNRNHYNVYRLDRSTSPLAVAQQLVSSAHHCPNLRHLGISMNLPTDVERRTSAEERVNSIAAALVEARAWPFMENFHCTPLSKIPSLQTLWPQAELK